MAGRAESDARVRAAYERRGRLGLDARYDYWQPSNLFIYQSRERAFLEVLRASGLLPLSGRRILDAVCGDGNVLLDLVRYGAEPAEIAGIDLLENRVEHARSRLPAADIRNANAQAIPFPDGAFDLVLAFTLISSVVEPVARGRVAAEIARVTAPGGLVVIYDFWVNPFNRHARSVKHSEVRRLFAGHTVSLGSVTLAPPLVRALAGRRGGWVASTLLEMLPFLRTHFLAGIHC
jgi:ubiquinone/menaquinone biosynthesis C-methylase UbiE